MDIYATPVGRIMAGWRRRKFVEICPVGECGEDARGDDPYWLFHFVVRHPSLVNVSGSGDSLYTTTGLTKRWRRR